jgi:hypothetical protein
MKNSRKALAAACALVMCAAAPGFTQNALTELQGGVNAFSESLAKSLPLNSSIGLNWSDAYIGQLLGAPPHFGVGVSAGISTMDFKAIDTLAASAGSSLPFELSKMIIPAYTAEARVGGFILPFDVGLKFGFLPVLDMAGVRMNYTLLGGDVRYAILKGNPLLPTLSVGAGVNYLQGGIGTTIPTGQSFSFGPAGASHTLAVSDADMDFSWESTALDFTVQASKSFILVTPYLGLGLNYAWSRAGYDIKSDLSYDGTPLGPADADRLKGDLAAAGITGIEVDTSGFSSIIDNTGLGLRIFGGISFNLAVIRIDLTGMYSFLSNDYGATLGLRFQL